MIDKDDEIRLFMKKRCVFEKYFSVRIIPSHEIDASLIIQHPVWQ